MQFANKFVAERNENQKLCAINNAEMFVTT